MAAIDFPNDPTVGDIFTVGAISYTWTGTVWVSEKIPALVPDANLDGGKADTIYGGIPSIFGGNASSF